MKKLSSAKIACIVVTFCALSGVAAFAQTFVRLAKFNPGDGYPANGPFIQGLDGNLYGTSSGGGPWAGGTFFTMTPGGSVTDLYGFHRGGGGSPLAGMVLGTDGNFYGAVSGEEGGAIFEINAEDRLTVLYYLCRSLNCAYDGNLVVPALVQGTDGDFYGTTSTGGTEVSGNFCNYCGTVFKITANGEFTTLYSFCSQPSCADGAFPFAALIQATDGNFYGTTSVGGANVNASFCPAGCGTIFEMTPEGVLTTLYSFCSLPNCADGYSPQSPVIQASDGNFYGTTPAGGAHGDSNSGGTVFQFTPAGKLTTLYSFCAQTGCTDGSSPDAGLLQGTDGNFYGTTEVGGANENDVICSAGCGTLFQITPGGLLTTLYSFCSDMNKPGNCNDGAFPTTSLMQSTRGGIYGTTSRGGIGQVGDSNYDCCGTAFFLSMGLGPFVETVSRSGEVGGSVTILGNDLGRTSSVAFNGTAAAFTVVSSTEITATVPTGATTGFVTVTTPIATLTSNKKFRVEP
jgi:uncharacterized repeat protein (TIGR03803 family)